MFLLFLQFVVIQALVIVLLMFAIGKSDRMPNIQPIQTADYLVPSIAGMMAGIVAYHYLPYFFALGESRGINFFHLIGGLAVGTIVTCLGVCLFRTGWFAWQSFKELAGWD